MCGLSVYMHMHPCVSGIHEGQKRVSGPLEVELWAVVSHLVGVGKNPGEKPVIFC